MLLPESVLLKLHLTHQIIAFVLFQFCLLSQSTLLIKTKQKIKTDRKKITVTHTRYEGLLRKSYKPKRKDKILNRKKRKQKT